MAKSSNRASPTPRTNAIGASHTSEDPRTQFDRDADARDPREREDALRTNDEGTALTVEQRRSMIRNEFLQEALPRVPEIPGYHACWLSTTNSYDPIHKRMRLGYTPVAASELRGFDSMKMASGEFAGAITCNEMVLFKIPTDTYLAIMHEFHHAMPAEEEEALRARLTPQDEDSEGKKLGEIAGDGFDDLEQRAKVREGIFAV